MGSEPQSILPPKKSLIWRIPEVGVYPQFSSMLFRILPEINHPAIGDSHHDYGKPIEEKNRDALDLAVLSLNNISIWLDLVVCRLHLLLLVCLSFKGTPKSMGYPLAI